MATMDFTTKPLALLEVVVENWAAIVARDSIRALEGRHDRDNKRTGWTTSDSYLTSEEDGLKNK
jgi:hypothetical protein